MNQIKITDLSIGDWVKIDDEYRIVRGIDATTGLISLYSLAMPCGLGVVRPIPITPEILEKNEFKKNGEYDEWNIGTWRTPYLLGVLLERPAITIKWNGSSIFINQAKYVHQLQHALRLTGSDKEIKL